MSTVRQEHLREEVVEVLPEIRREPKSGKGTHKKPTEVKVRGLAWMQRQAPAETTKLDLDVEEEVSSSSGPEAGLLSCSSFMARWGLRSMRNLLVRPGLAGSRPCARWRLLGSTARGSGRNASVVAG